MIIYRLFRVIDHLKNRTSASTNKTEREPSAVNRLAKTQPAEPAPTMIWSNLCFRTFSIDLFQNIFLSVLSFYFSRANTQILTLNNLRLLKSYKGHKDIFLFFCFNHQPSWTLTIGKILFNYRLHFDRKRRFCRHIFSYEELPTAWVLTKLTQDVIFNELLLLWSAQRKSEKCCKNNCNLPHNQVLLKLQFSEVIQQTFHRFWCKMWQIWIVVRI